MKVKHINLEFEMKGKGIVNYDSKGQKHIWIAKTEEVKNTKMVNIHGNCLYSKKAYFRRENGMLDYKVKISSEALRKAIFGEDAIATNSSISAHKTLLNSFIGSVMGLTRGYVFTTKEQIKRKSPLTITPAIQTCNSESFFEICTKSGEKTLNKSKAKKDKDQSTENSNDTSLFNRETIGDIKYSGEGFIDLVGLGFISADPIFDRCAFNADDYELLEQFLEKNIPNFKGQLGYHKLKTASVEEAEYGVSLSEENVLFLVKEILKRIASLRINRGGAYAELTHLKVELVIDPLDKSKNIKIDINGLEDIENLDFSPDSFYKLVEGDQVLEARKKIKEALMESNKKK